MSYFAKWCQVSLRWHNVDGLGDEVWVGWRCVCGWVRGVWRGIAADWVECCGGGLFQREDDVVREAWVVSCSAISALRAPGGVCGFITPFFLTCCSQNDDPSLHCKSTLLTSGCSHTLGLWALMTSKSPFKMVDKGHYPFLNWKVCFCCELSSHFSCLGLPVVQCCFRQFLIPSFCSSFEQIRYAVE